MPYDLTEAEELVTEASRKLDHKAAKLQHFPAVLEALAKLDGHAGASFKLDKEKGTVSVGMADKFVWIAFDDRYYGFTITREGKTGSAADRKVGIVQLEYNPGNNTWEGADDPTHTPAAGERRRKRSAIAVIVEQALGMLAD